MNRLWLERSDWCWKVREETQAESGRGGLGWGLGRTSSTRGPLHMLNISIPSKHLVVH